MERQIRRSPLWDHITEELSKRGYTLEEKLSRRKSDNPSQSSVWKASYEDNGYHALKISSTMIMESFEDIDPNKLDELAEREIAIMKQVNHPNIPPYRDFFVIPFEDFNSLIRVLATQYIDMPNLLDRISKKDRLSEEEASTLLGNVLSALHHVHTELEEPVLHRDIKPSNILFDGKKAYLFDFNFSRIGEGESSSTRIDNYGYYPVDAYSGRQTASQDLVGLGNVVIGGAQGMEIAQIRSKQGKWGLEAVDVEDLSFSPNLKRFLRKLTAENPALRYQTAEQALSDLSYLPEMSEDELEKKIVTVTRREGLQKVLDRLEKQDFLFDYNVSPNIRATYDDDSLIEHLRKIYGQEAFIVEDPIEIEKYAGIGHRVIKKGDYSGGHLAGEVLKVYSYGNVKVKFNPMDKRKLPIEELILIGEYNDWNYRRYPNRTRLNDSKQLKKDHWVEYVGKGAHKFFVPDGSFGLISSTVDGLYEVLWAQDPGVEWNYEYRWKKNSAVFPNEIKLYIPNHINFPDLYKEVMGEHLPEPIEI